MIKANVRTPRLFTFPHATSSLFYTTADSFFVFTPPELCKKTYVGDPPPGLASEDQASLVPLSFYAFFSASVAGRSLIPGE
jgi:hypothetical protein